MSVAQEDSAYSDEDYGDGADSQHSQDSHRAAANGNAAAVGGGLARAGSQSISLGRRAKRKGAYTEEERRHRRRLANRWGVGPWTLPTWHALRCHALLTLLPSSTVSVLPAVISHQQHNPAAPQHMPCPPPADTHALCPCCPQGVCQTHAGQTKRGGEAAGDHYEPAAGQERTAGGSEQGVCHLPAAAAAGDVQPAQPAATRQRGVVSASAAEQQRGAPGELGCCGRGFLHGTWNFLCMENPPQTSAQLAHMHACMPCVPFTSAPHSLRCCMLLLLLLCRC